jgi:hypothetical protein
VMKTIVLTTTEVSLHPTPTYRVAAYGVDTSFATRLESYYYFIVVLIL